MNEFYNKEIALAQAVIDIAATGAKPSKRKIIKITGGSFSSKWFVEAFCKIKYISSDFEDIDFIKKKYKLKKTVKSPSALLDDNSHLKKKIEYLEKYVLGLENKNAHLQDYCSRVDSENIKLNKLLDDLSNDRKKLIQEIRNDKDSQINSLLKELGQTHQEYREIHKEMGRSRDDETIEYKVEIINLKDKLKVMDAKNNKMGEQILMQQKKIQNLINENQMLMSQIHSKVNQ